MGAVFKGIGGAGVGFAGDGERTVFPFQFAVFGSDDVVVRVDGKPVTTGFHVALNDTEEAPGGAVISRSRHRWGPRFRSVGICGYGG